MNSQPDIKEAEFRILRDFIHEYSGIFLNEEKISFLKMKLHPRVVYLGLSSFYDYINYIKYHRLGERELSRAISLLTNNETYFFRESAQINILADVILPGFRDKKIIKGDKSLKILSAGCSTGEEVYSIAMTVFETGAFFWGWDLNIVGIDINEKALKAAREGIYSPRSLRMTETDLVNKFFIKNCEYLEVKDHIRKMAVFYNGNIIDPLTWEAINNIDVIFCRNVLIYFSEDKIKATIENFHKALKNDGYLFLGHSETLTGISELFEPVRFPDTIIYRKL